MNADKKNGINSSASICVHRRFLISSLALLASLAVAFLFSSLLRHAASPSQSAKIATSSCHRWSITSTVQPASLRVAGATFELRRSFRDRPYGGTLHSSPTRRDQQGRRATGAAASVDSSQGGDSSPGRPCADRAVVVLAVSAPSWQPRAPPGGRLAALSGQNQTWGYPRAEPGAENAALRRRPATVAASRGQQVNGAGEPMHRILDLSRLVNDAQVVRQRRLQF